MKSESVETITSHQARIAFPAIFLGKDDIWKLPSEKSMNKGNTLALRQAQSDIGRLIIDSRGGCFRPTLLVRGKPLDPWWDIKNRLLLGRYYEWLWEFRIEPTISIEVARERLLEHAENDSYPPRSRRYLRRLAKAESFDAFAKQILDEFK